MHCFSKEISHGERPGQVQPPIPSTLHWANLNSDSKAQERKKTTKKPHKKQEFSTGCLLHLLVKQTNKKLRKYFMYCNGGSPASLPSHSCCLNTPYCGFSIPKCFQIYNQITELPICSTINYSTVLLELKTLKKCIFSSRKCTMSLLSAHPINKHLLCLHHIRKKDCHEFLRSVVLNVTPD